MTLARELFFKVIFLPVLTLIELVQVYKKKVSETTRKFLGLEISKAKK